LELLTAVFYVFSPELDVQVIDDFDTALLLEMVKFLAVIWFCVHPRIPQAF
jgi:hypothetical protein